MKIISRALYIAIALGVVLVLSSYGGEGNAGAPAASNPMKANQQQFDRMHDTQVSYVHGGSRK
ncbi:hypothetical protein N0M98_26510 [Paenibacillus doosanensis]|uniref:Uncharacterized protein n=1 Tax=Paenibacillus konkukensis TaxID=2020716 RepID=A0ABY4RNP7_9BACL|nr:MULTISPECIES: hypothetical protein [Paenibacillus]MCS7463663.1 hypothetical protein [Paenibacillus doosanensis]UQZ83188.1 hypothetical protein SK3146_02349 [Paenibacillus konkukensis]